MERCEALELLPRIGSTIMRVPSNRLPDQLPVPLPCIVVKVHRRHLWYMVRFKSGVRECYKVPEVKHYTEQDKTTSRVANHMVKRPRGTRLTKCKKEKKE